MSEKKPSNDELVGQTIAGRYRIISRLGAGGMGVAYRAWNEAEEVPVVIKIPKKAFLDDPKFAERFAREIRLLQGLTHPHIVPIVDVGEHEHLPYVVMRFLPGGSLSNRRLRGDDGKVRPNPPGMLHLWLPAVADALDHVHANGVIHRDVKPGNIFFDAYWNAFLGDFGIAKIVEESDTFDREQTLTATNMGMGTPDYMAPEQFSPKPALDGRTDQYALAVMAYEMVAGMRPFTGNTAHLIVEVTTMPVPRLDRLVRGLPPSLVESVHRGLAKTPQERFGTCREFAYHLLSDVPLLVDEPDIARLLCPKCSNILKLPVSAAGEKGKCPRCQTRMKVADDLGALWLLDEARRQRQAAGSVVDIEDIEEEPDPSGSRMVTEEEALDVFKPVSSTTPIEKTARRKPKKISAEMIFGGLAAAAIALAGLWILFNGAPSQPKRRDNPNDMPGKNRESVIPYAQRLAQAEATVRKNPFDCRANDFLGRHWCFRQGDWQKGLPYMAKSGAPGLWSVAKKQVDLESTEQRTNPVDRIRLSKAWWSVAEQEGLVAADEVKAIQKHAAAIYMGAVDDLIDAKDIEDANRWLTRNPEFLTLVGNKRPPGVPAAIGGLRPGSTVVFESFNFRDHYLSIRRDGQVIISRGLESAVPLRVSKGLADPTKVSFELRDKPNSFLINNSGLLKERQHDGTPQFKENATFGVSKGLAEPTWISFLAKSPPSHFIRHQHFLLKVHAGEGDLFRKDATFRAVDCSSSTTAGRVKGAEVSVAAAEILARPPLENSIGMKLKLIPPGTFMMVSNDGEKPVNPLDVALKPQLDANDDEEDEKPLHQVRITKPFYIGVTEVTNAEWRRVMGGEPPSQWKEDNRPVEMVSRSDALDFCKKLSESPAEKATGRMYRLPTEAEWEYACRAGTMTRYSFGDDETLLGEFAWFGNNSGQEALDTGRLAAVDAKARSELLRANQCQTHPTGQKRKNPWGLHDMHGNVSEWCFGLRKDLDSTHTSPLDTLDLTKEYIARGGDYESKATALSRLWKKSASQPRRGR